MSSPTSNVCAGRRGGLAEVPARHAAVVEVRRLEDLGSDLESQGV